MTERSAQDLARLILNGFRAYRNEFGEITAAAKHRFETADWQSVLAASKIRLDLYREYLRPVVAQLKDVEIDRTLRQSIRAAYHESSRDEWDAELAETFFNSIHRAMTSDQAVDDTQMFVTTALPVNRPLGRDAIVRRFTPENGVFDMVKSILHVRRALCDARDDESC